METWFHHSQCELCCSVDIIRLSRQKWKRVFLLLGLYSSYHFFRENMKTRAPCQLRQDSRVRCAGDKKHFRHSGLTLKTDRQLINTHRSWGGVQEALWLQWSCALWNIERWEVFVVDFDPSAAYLSVSSISAVASHQSFFLNFFPQDLTSTLIQIRSVSYLC